MLIIGSQAMKHHKLLGKGRKIHDTDFICTFQEFKDWTKKHRYKIELCVPLSGDKFHVRFQSGWNFEFEIAWPGSTAEDLMRYNGNGYASPEVLYALKMSHRYLKDSPHFLKNMRDIQRFRRKGVGLTRGWLRDVWLPRREEATYVYKHPKLDVSKGEFFNGDGVQYVYDHDSIHLTVALTERTHVQRCSGPSVPGKLISYGEEVVTTYPAYTFYMKDGSEVMTSKDKFFSVPEQIRLYGVYEESCVLALERSQIPYPAADPRKSFETALMKVCTSITSGWFREYAWENYDRVISLYESLGESDYVERFKRNAHLLKPYKAAMM